MSVERVTEYTQLPSEPNLKDKVGMGKNKSKAASATPATIPKDWPTHGCIKLTHVYMRYSDDDAPVLKGLNLVIRPGEKVKENEFIVEFIR